MNILLINKSIVVSRLVAICARDIEASVDEIDNISNLKKDNYDMIIVDGEINSQELEDSINKIISKSKIILYSKLEDNLSNYDIKIKKPFLPQKLTDILNKFNSEKSNSIIKENIDNSFIEALINMPSQKIKDILLGAEVTIKIKFPKD
ncbi:Highly acidic protein [hydrothermal vent metagenome]|uniref:Highly acidic protein n=1 Tax=hydrothermal vent metagenome TaxID=652676 RepID=A0A1W1EIC1_9ZZZZ